MTPVIRISDATWERLKKFAVPLEDTPDDAVRKVLEIAEAQRGGSTPAQPPQGNQEDTLRQVLNRAGGRVEDLTPKPPTISRTTRTRRLSQGQKTPVEAYQHPILETLYRLGGSGHANDVLAGVERKMGPVLSAVDYETMPSGQVRWINTAHWARYALVQRGLLKSNSKRGIWELTERGRAETLQNTPLPPEDRPS